MVCIVIIRISSRERERPFFGEVPHAHALDHHAHVFCVVLCPETNLRQGMAEVELHLVDGFGLAFPH